MELDFFSAKTMPKTQGNGRKKVARIAFGKTGVICINQPLADLIGLKPNGKISLAQDKNEPENWYIFIDPNGFEVRKGYKNKGLMFNYKDLVRSFMKAFGKDLTETHSFLVATQPTTMEDSKTQYWGILVGR